MNLVNYCAELSRWLPSKYHHEVYFVGGVLLSREITDVDIFVYGTHTDKIEMKLHKKCFSNNKELEVLTSLSTDDFFDSKKNSLTNYILTQGLTKPVLGFNFNRLTYEGLFLSKLAAFEQRESETLKDLPDIQKLLEKFEFNIPKILKKVIREFDLNNTFFKIKDLNHRSAYY
jgi:hypothetical protein